jgi:hypothetical protein
MDYSSVKEAVQSCPQLNGLDGGTLAELFWIGKEKKVRRGTVVYKQGEVLDGTIYLLADGMLAVWIDGALVVEISAPTLIGEGAFASASHIRAATLQVSSESAALLEFRPSQEMLDGPLSALFSNVAWDRWLTVTQMEPG